MKKSISFLMAFVLLAAAGLQAQQLSLDDTIKRAARGIEDVLPQRALVAVLNFASPSETFSDYVIEELTGELVIGRKVTIVDRRSLSLISQEMNLQLSGDVSDESAQAIGRLLGAQSIVSGTLTNMGTFHRFRIKVITVETAAIQTQISLDMRNDDQVAFLLGNRPASAPQAAAPATASQQATYKIGDTGPAGGLIFYDKGNNSGGWRYLEAAPEDIGELLFATEDFRIPAERAVGKGKTNTEAIMREANSRGGGFRWAARECDALVVNSFDDWFLPSMDELNYMYGNLYLRNLGGFFCGWYGTSTYADSNYMRRNEFMAQNFSDGMQRGGGYMDRPHVRAIRQF
jgi:TolB-like protein